MGIGIGAPRGKEGEKEQRVSGNRDRSTTREKGEKEQRVSGNRDRSTTRERRGEGTEGEWE